MTTTIPRASASPASRRRRRRGLVPALALAFVAVLGLGAWSWWHGVVEGLPLREHCTATAAGKTTELDPEQSGNAAVIAAVAVERGLPGRAATIGIATAIQESKLVNLPGGDRDSLGLFQQRPSQGWGTPTQIRDPVYAANAFYDVLVKVEGYESLPITKAAQTVQRSAFPSAYADHEPEARILASALTGYSPAGLSCALAPLDKGKQDAGSGGLTPRARAVVTAAAKEAGRAGTAVAGDPTAVRFTLRGKGTTLTAWALAHWAVARAKGLDVVSVETDGQRWTRDGADSAWRRTTGAAPAGTVLVRVA